MCEEREYFKKADELSFLSSEYFPSISKTLAFPLCTPVKQTTFTLKTARFSH